MIDQRVHRDRVDLDSGGGSDAEVGQPPISAQLSGMIVIPEENTDPLVGLARAGVESAFIELAEREKARMWTVCFRITGNHQDTEDALQDAVFAAWRGISLFRGEAQFSTWISRIASNAAMAQVKKRRPWQPLGCIEPPSPCDVGEDVASAAALHDALSQLPEVYRVTFMLRAYGDLSYADIAKRLGVPTQTVRSRLSRARAALRSILESDYPPP